ncbi:MAG TPA: sigma-70 family RNA polymerase sigma factor [Candidatus Xenobia bacterium]|nr:sigma-70 family RNA polymerase sigma factor [Candidatus Xenobia bacterium]
MADEPELAFLEQLRQKQSAKPGWSYFIQHFSGLLLQTIRESESDYDQVLDRYLFVCQKLAERECKRLLSFKRGGQREFSAWLRAVTRNLCIDYLREQQGRRRLPRAIARLSSLDQEVFESSFWHGHNATETYEKLRPNHPGLRFAQVLESSERIQVALQPWQLQKVLEQKPVPSPVSPIGSEGENLLEQVPDGRAGPEEDALLQEKARLLQGVVAELPERARMLLRLRFELGLTLQEVARLSGLGDHRKVHEELARILEQLQCTLKERGWSG